MSISKINKVIELSEKILKGKKERVQLVLANILANGHTLIEDSPGVGKTTLVKYLGKALDLNISRIQFTNDILPADIIGTSIFNKAENRFDFHKGPLFGELILADELNRAPPKTQSALLQAMEERSISIEGNNFKLPPYFTVIATQNPNIQIGTFDLPESQLDRFSMKIAMGYADKNSTILLLKEINQSEILTNQKSIINKEELMIMQSQINDVHIEDSIYEKIYQILEVSRNDSSYISLSNRCGLDLVKLSKVWAILNDRNYVIPDDLYYLFSYVAGHRLVSPENSDINYETKISKKLLEQVK